MRRRLSTGALRGACTPLSARRTLILAAMVSVLGVLLTPFHAVADEAPQDPVATSPAAGAVAPGGSVGDVESDGSADDADADPAKEPVHVDEAEFEDRDAGATFTTERPAATPTPDHPVTTPTTRQAVAAAPEPVTIRLRHEVRDGGGWAPGDGAVGFGEEYRYLARVEVPAHVSRVRVTAFVPGHDPDDAITDVPAALVAGTLRCEGSVRCTPLVEAAAGPLTPLTPLTWDVEIDRDLAAPTVFDAIVTVRFGELPAAATFDHAGYFRARAWARATVTWSTGEGPGALALTSTSNEVVVTATAFQIITPGGALPDDDSGDDSDHDSGRDVDESTDEDGVVADEPIEDEPAVAPPVDPVTSSPAPVVSRLPDTGGLGIGWLLGAGVTISAGLVMLMRGRRPSPTS